MKIHSYDMKLCPLCGKGQPTNYTYREQDDFVAAMYDCECQWDHAAEYAAHYSHNEYVRQRYEGFRRTLPEEYQRYMLKPVEPRVGNVAAMEALADFPKRRMFFLHGDAGLGKTHLAIRTAMKAVDRAETVRFVSELDLISEARSNALTGGVINRLTGQPEPLPRVLVIDDVAKEKASEFYARTFYRVLEACIAGGRGLIMTSNHSPEEVAARVAQDENNRRAIISRLHAGQVLRLTGRDERQGSL